MAGVDGRQLVFDERFDDPAGFTERWIPHYLPQWSSRDRSRARWRLEQDGLHLLIEADQQPWAPEWDGPLRVSNLQTGLFSGPLGSPAGQHRHRADLVVRTPQPHRRLWTPSAGYVEVVLRASPDPTCLTAVWLVGVEDSSPEDSGEVCVAELFGRALANDRSQVRLGIKAHHDPRLRTEMMDLVLDLDATQEHAYAAARDEHRLGFLVDDVEVHRVEQGTAYPLQLMVDLFELPVGEQRDPADYPKAAYVRSVRGWSA